MPSGASPGQTLLLSIQRPHEYLELVVPAGAVVGDTLAAPTSFGHTVHVTCPPGATAGARLLLCVPVPVQGLHVHTPPEARAGQTIAFPLPSPFAPTSADGAYSASAMLATDLALAREQRANGGGSNGKRRPGNADAPEDEVPNSAPGGGAPWSGGAVAGTEALAFVGAGPSSAPPSPAMRRGRRPQTDELLRSAQNEALQTLRNFKTLADRMGGAPVGAAERRGAVDVPALHRLRCLPEVLATWALCEVVRGRIGMRLITLPQLESMLCSDLPTTAPWAGQPSHPPTPQSTATLRELAAVHHTLLLALAQLAPPFAALGAPISAPVPASAATLASALAPAPVPSAVSTGSGKTAVTPDEGGNQTDDGGNQTDEGGNQTDVARPLSHL